MSEVKHSIALLGNPNSGKTALFNLLTGLNQKVSNYPGVTVEQTTGIAKINNIPVTIIDLPGTYSLVPESHDEAIVATEFMKWAKGENTPDCILSVVDATNLMRNLYLTTQLLDLGKPVIVALNMIDLARKKSIMIDSEKLKNDLGVFSVIPVSARLNEGIDDLKRSITQVMDYNDETPIVFPIPEPIQNAILPLQNWYQDTFKFSENLSRSFAIRTATIDTTQGIEPPDPQLINTCKMDLKKIGFPYETLEPTLRYHWLDQVVPASEIPIEKKSNSEKTDEILTHTWGGPLIFVGLLAFIFQVIFSWATVPMNLIDVGIAQLGNWLAHHLPTGLLSDLLVEGIIGGAGAILIFLPQILFLIFFLTMLEDSGYMARVAIMMDKAMTKVGLHGRSVLPLMSGFACAIPGIMSTRTIDSWKERLVTIMVLPLMSCSARLPVYTLMISAFIPDKEVFGIFGLQGLTMVLMYFLGTVTAMILAVFFSKWIKTERKSSFIMELPPYRIPLMRSVFRQVYTRGKLFVTDAGKIIMAISIVLWFLASFPKIDSSNGETKSIHSSYAADIGKAIEPMIAPLGFDWKIGLGLVTSFAAREVVVSTLATIYNVENDGEDMISLSDAMKRDKDPNTGKSIFTPLVALSLMVFYVYAAQCMATFAIVKRETNSWKWPVFMVIYMTALAYFSSLIVYQGGLMMGFS
jgi:ferrous iron transport protein B